jgi:hypothetical protein
MKLGPKRIGKMLLTVPRKGHVFLFRLSDTVLEDSHNPRSERCEIK